MCRKGHEKLTYIIIVIQKIRKEKKIENKGILCEKQHQKKKNEKCLSDMSRENKKVFFFNGI